MLLSNFIAFQVSKNFFSRNPLFNSHHVFDLSFLLSLLILVCVEETDLGVCDNYGRLLLPASETFVIIDLHAHFGFRVGLCIHVALIHRF